MMRFVDIPHGRVLVVDDSDLFYGFERFGPDGEPWNAGQPVELLVRRRDRKVFRPLVLEGAPTKILVEV